MFNKDINFVIKFTKHCETENHKMRCGWTLKRNWNSPSGFDTVRISTHNTITNFYRRETNQVLMDHAEPDIVHDIVPHIVHDLATDATGTQTDSTQDQVDRGTCFDTFVNNPTDSEACTQTEGEFHPIPVTDKNVSCSGKEVEELLAPNFELDLKAFLHSMKFELKTNFSIDDVRRYYDAHPIARKFTENGFSRDLAQCHHSICIKDYVIGKALKHTIPSAVEWSEDLGGPALSTIKRACRTKVRRVQTPVIIVFITIFHNRYKN